MPIVSATDLPLALQAAVIQSDEISILTYLLDAALCGILSVQIYFYYLAFTQDRWTIKSFVYSIYVLNSASTGIFIYNAFMTFGPGFATVDSATKIHSDWYVAPILGSFVAFATQLFYAYRNHILSNSRLIPFIIATIALVSNISALAESIRLSQLTDVALVHNFFESLTAGIWFGCSALTDILIAVCMTYYLLKHDTDFRQTHATILRLVRMIIETGTTTALIALTSIMLFFAFPDHVYYVAGVVVLPKSYSIAALMILNSRAEIVGRRVADISVISTGLRFAHTVSTKHEGDAHITTTRDELVTNNGSGNTSQEQV
ncbi:hypothetical protein FB45DRAFT_1029280 [Roridomyces roridus]|uniref:DUF6534 domain-containing protein n=1 Tax=Roridomyces roridus TaxID=1738132 RepID=A0AAD7FM70_9AGAR|nr:hypothetical protein FB45DRAFT_1029280 [Roridomyces roridus]